MLCCKANPRGWTLTGAWLVSCQDPSLWPAAVDEICRYHTASAYALRRVAKEDVQLRDMTIKYAVTLRALGLQYSITNESR